MTDHDLKKYATFTSRMVPTKRGDKVVMTPRHSIATYRFEEPGWTDEVKFVESVVERLGAMHGKTIGVKGPTINHGVGSIEITHGTGTKSAGPSDIRKKLKCKSEQLTTVMMIAGPITSRTHEGTPREGTTHKRINTRRGTSKTAK